MPGQVERASPLGWATAVGSLLTSQEAFHPPQRLNVRLTEHLRRGVREVDSPCEVKAPSEIFSPLLEPPWRSPVERPSLCSFIPGKGEAVTLLSAGIGGGTGEKGAICKISFQRACISPWELGLSRRKSSP